MYAINYFSGSKYPGGGLKSSGHKAWKSQSGLYYLRASCGETGGRAHPAEMQTKRAAVKINNVQWRLGQHVICWDSIEEAVRANTQLHIWRAEDMRPLRVFQNKSSAMRTRTQHWNCRTSGRLWHVKPFRLYPRGTIMILPLLTYHHTRTRLPSARPDAFQDTNGDIPGHLIY